MWEVFGRSFFNLFDCHMATIWIVSNPSFSIESLEFLKDESIIRKFSIFFTIDAYSSDEFVVALWDFFLTINAREDEMINIYTKRHWFIQFKSFAALVFIKSFHFDNQNMRSCTQESLREKSIVKAILATLSSSVDIEVLVQLMVHSANSFAAKT